MTVSLAAPAITFAVPYHSNIPYLLEAVRSVISQSRTDWELIVVDDAGQEPAAEALAAFADPRISVHRNATNLGLAGNWNECVSRASAPWVTLLHADDRLADGYAAAVLDAIARRPHAAAVFTDADIIGADGRPARSLRDSVKRFASRPRGDHDVSGDDGLASILANNYVMCPTLCYRVDIARGIPFDTRWRMVMDLDHTAQLLLAGHTLHGVRRPLYEYRRHTSNQSSSLTASAVRFEEEIALYREYEAITAANGWEKSARTARHRWMVRTHLGLQAALDLAARRFRPAAHKTRLLLADLSSGIRRGVRLRNRP